MYSVGPQIWFKPAKNQANFIVEFGLMFPLISASLNNTHNSYDVKTDGYSINSKIKFFHKRTDEFLFDFDMGLSLENYKSYLYRDLRTISVPVINPVIKYLYSNVFFHIFML